ncbi:MAG TPA: ASPIC/UnbV domain-containing protein [Bryobacteraceae bacterium]|nr:ASPIC/UnbV domain-containing protein [Bryobacteraceae bacterium]
MSQTPRGAGGSRRYDDGWRAINELIRSGGSFSGHERKVVYRNLGNGKFADVSFVSGLDSDADGRAFAVLDLDGDGALDLALKNRTGPQLRLMRNTLGGRSLIIELQGVKGNRDAVGARAELVTNRRTRVKEVHSGSAFLSQSSRRLHFGLEEGEAARELRIRWAGSRSQTLSGLPAQGTIRIEEGGGWREIPRPAHRSEPEPAGEQTTRPWLVSALPAPVPSQGATRWTLVNFAADWCPPCRAEQADWKANERHLRTAGVSIRTIDVDNAAQRDLVAAYSLLYRNIFDLHREMGLPMSFLLDASGAVVKVYQGLAAAREILADVKSGKRPSLPFDGIRAGPARGRNWNEIAGAMAEHGLTAPARLYFETALARGDGSDELRNNYAAVLIAAGDTARAGRLLGEMPERPEALVNLGLLYLSSNRASQAVAPLEKATALQPDDGAAWGALGMAYSASDRKREAIAALEKAQALGGRGSNQANELGILYMESGQAPLAKIQFEAAVALDPNNAAAMRNLARYALESGDEAESRKWTERVRQIERK